MLAVGYGVENSVEFALIQNQWGVGWGEEGLIRVGLTDSLTRELHFVAVRAVFSFTSYCRFSIH
jgi:Papain family cysteine protease